MLSYRERSKRTRLFIYTAFALVFALNVLFLPRKYKTSFPEPKPTEIPWESLLPEPDANTRDHLNRIWRQLVYRPPKSAARPSAKAKIYILDDSTYMTPDEKDFAGCAVQNCQIFVGRPPSDHLGELQVAIEQSCDQDAHCLSVFFTMESHTYYSTVGWTSVNITATHLLRSDVPAPYGYYLTNQKIDYLKSQGLLNWSLAESSPTFDPTRNYARGKRKKVAWFVSHCAGGRLAYVRELAKYIQVDIFGYCGKLKCQRGNGRCAEMLARDYKFYLAFENSRCEDYVTEKFFDTGLKNSIVPVVYGAPLDFYSAVGPPHSFIHVDQFRSPRALAHYLTYLDQNDTAYNAYFQWLSEGRVVSSAFWCRLCGVLNPPGGPLGGQGAPQQTVLSPKDVKEWWNETGACQG